jgi:hypothetical protein
MTSRQFVAIVSLCDLFWKLPESAAGLTRNCPGENVRGLKLPPSAVELISERMREQLNSNPLVQLAVVGVLLVGAALFFMSSSGGGEEESAGTTEATVGVVGTEASGTATGATPGEAVEGAVDEATEAAGSSLSALSAVDQTAAVAPPLPAPVLDAWKSNQTLVLLFTRDGGIDDRLVKDATTSLEGFSEAEVFVVPAAKISRYAAITEGVGVDRVPALVVVGPKNLKKTVPTASVSYGFQSPQSVTQAVIDAGYEGKTLDYHP